MLWKAIAAGSNVPTVEPASTFTLPSVVSPTSLLPATPLLPAATNLVAYVVAPGTYPALFIVVQPSPDAIAFLLARSPSPSAPPQLVATATASADLTYVPPGSLPGLSAAVAAGSLQVADSSPPLDFPPFIFDPSGHVTALPPDSLPTTYLAYASHYTNPSAFILDSATLNQLLLYGTPSPANNIITSGTQSLQLKLADFRFTTTTGSLYLFAIDQTLSARPAIGSCFTTTHIDFGLPVGSYSAIDVHLTALVLASEHPHAPTRILIVEAHPLSARGSPCL